MNQLLKDAIADAKAVRETALANAKVALEEAFAPKLQSMLSHKIKEEMEEDGVEMAEEEPTEVALMQKRAGIMAEEDEEAMEAEEEIPSEEEEMESEEEMDFEDEDMADDEMEAEDEMDFEDEEEVSDEDLEEILRELEGGEEEEEMEVKMESEDPEAYDMKDEAKKKHKMMEMEDEEEEIDLEEIIQALREEDEEEVEEEEVEKTEEELEEAYSVIKYLRAKLNEVNLLNAKLLFVNKLFKKNDLNESQKVKIIETFDRAKNVREAKLIYATLSESVNKNKVAPKAKRVMNEGFASAPQKKTQIITESDKLYTRFKTLVDYNKK